MIEPNIKNQFMEHTAVCDNRLIYTNDILVLKKLQYDWLFKVKHQFMAYWQQENRNHILWCAR